MRRLLYSKWFFLMLAIVCTVDLIADVGEEIWGRGFLNWAAILMDLIALSLATWIFGDLHVRRPKNGDDTSGR